MLKEFKVANLVGAHCTGIEALHHLRDRIGLTRKTALVGSVGGSYVLSSGIAGTMWANRSGIQSQTVRQILLAWALTLPAVMLLSGVCYWLATRLLP